jgi:hypothetical protein
MGYRLLADAVMLVHFGFLLFIALGGFITWQFPRVFPLHMVAVGWGLLIVFGAVDCPLTSWEDRFRRLAGQAGLSDGFIGTYLTGVIYPAEHLRSMQLLVAALVVVSWTGLALARARAATRR